MNVTRATTTFGACLLVTIAGLVVAEDDGFEALLQEISQPSPTQQPAGATAAEVTESTVDEEVNMDADIAAPEYAAEEIAPEVVAEVEAVAEAEGFAETPALEPASDLLQPEDSQLEAEAAPVQDETLAEEPVAVPVEDMFSAPPESEETVSVPTEESAPFEPAYDEPAPVEMETAAEPVVEEMMPVEEEPIEVMEEVMVPVEEVTAVEVESPMEEETLVDSAPAEEAEETVMDDAAPTEDAVSPKAGKPEARELARKEEIRRQAREKQALMSLESGMKSAASRDYDKAIKDLEIALADLPDRQANHELREQGRAKLADAYARKANSIVSQNGKLTDALTAAQKADEYGYRDADSLIARIKKEQERQDFLAKQPVPPAKRKEYKDKQAEIQDLLVQGRQYFKLADYNASEALYEKVLLQDEYNVEAMRYLRKIGELRYKIHTYELRATEADMVQKVRDAWNPPIREEVSLPSSVLADTRVEKKTGAQRLQEKMEKITFPLIDFRQANIVDVVKFLNEESANLDQPDGVGVNIILNLNIPGSGGGETAAPSQQFAPSAPVDDLFGGGSSTATESFGGSEPSSPSFSPGSPMISLTLRRVNLLNAIKYITEVANLKFRIDDDAIIITPAGVVQGRVVTRLYPVQPTFLDVVIDKGANAEAQNQDRGEFVAMGSTSTTIKRPEVKEFFEKAGVPFPAGTSITFNPGISQLIVANTPENLEIFERILSQLNVIPNQVEIEARFVEIGQDDLEELGMQWILTDDYEFAQKTSGAAPVAGQERIQVNKDLEGFSKGLRFFEFGASGDFVPNSAARALNPVGNIATIASVLTNPELTVVIQALSQHGGSDLLSAPRVTTRSGVNAQIQVVREIIYPTEFETTQPQFSNSAGDTQIVTPPLVTPGSFETRQTGVILNVTPTVGPDGYTIDLTMVPEVTELVDWINYGSTFGDFVFNIPQPIFATRQVTTSIVIWDGQTVVMGGLIREDLIKVHDKIPILGDIPLIGKLFQSNGEYSKKKNLLIFVTARLVDPAGKTIHKASEVGAVTEGAAAGDTTIALP